VLGVLGRREKKGNGTARVGQARGREDGNIEEALGLCHGGGELSAGQCPLRLWHAQGRQIEGRRVVGRCWGDAWR
jgi:hypothetical protein